MDKSCTESKDPISISQIQELLKSELETLGTQGITPIPSGNIYDDDDSELEAILISRDPHLGCTKPRQKKKEFKGNQDTCSFDDMINTNIVKNKRDAKMSKINKDFHLGCMKPHQKKKGFEENRDTSSFDDTINTYIIKQKQDAKKSKVGEIQNENIRRDLHLEYTKPRQKKKGFEENKDTFSLDDTINTNIVKRKRDAKKTKVTMKVLGEIQNISTADDTIDPKRKRETKKNTDKVAIQNEEIEHVAEEINNKFKEIEQYQLLVE